MRLELVPQPDVATAMPNGGLCWAMRAGSGGRHTSYIISRSGAVALAPIRGVQKGHSEESGEARLIM